MLKEKINYGYNDITIIPSCLSFVQHRSDCNPFKNGKLPIFTAPMSTVINENNKDLFKKNGIIPILPRSIDKEIRFREVFNGWVALSLGEVQEFIRKYPDKNSLPKTAHILIDVANGHMKSVLETGKLLNELYSNKLKLMGGNIANPDTYLLYCQNGFDFVRVGIGGGAGCITSTQTSIHSGIATLLNDITQIKEEFITLSKTDIFKETKVIADGGIRGYADVIKALALGADYVMIGGLFSQLIESAAPTYYYTKDSEIQSLDLFKYDKITEENGNFYWETNNDGVFCINSIFKTFYGMASKSGQKDLFGCKKHTSEGIEKTFECTTNMKKWVDNMKDYLTSAMSYCNIFEIADFNPYNVQTEIISINEKQAINQ